MTLSVQRFSRFSPAIVRWGVGLVFLIFGIWQWANPQSWYGYLPSSLPLGFSQSTAIALNGTLDFALGVLLLLGLFTRVVAILAAVHLAIITSTLGWNDIMVRDLGLCIVLIAVFLHGSDDWCLDEKMSAKFKDSALGKILYLFD